MSELSIAFIGKLRSGKDLAAEYLVKEEGLYRIAFADELKAVVHSLFTNVDRESKPRALYQNFGQYARNIDPDVWVNRLNESVCLQREMGGIEGFVLTDIRYRNELDWARKNGFVVIRIDADEDTRLERARAAGDDFDESTLDHETEQNIDSLPYNYRISNNGTPEGLYASLGLVINAIKKSAS